ncbi:hypothetical protein M3Y99_01602100 [Aphelenchoides fujianensis]|nr:hypothetical protein M3Y99_01602100 [Aphelenchoides fujianensis]
MLAHSFDIFELQTSAARGHRSPLPSVPTDSSEVANEPAGHVNGPKADSVATRTRSRTVPNSRLFVAGSSAAQMPPNEITCFRENGERTNAVGTPTHKPKNDGNNRTGLKSEANSQRSSSGIKQKNAKLRAAVADNVCFDKNPPTQMSLQSDDKSCATVHSSTPSSRIMRVGSPLRASDLAANARVSTLRPISPAMPFNRCMPFELELSHNTNDGVVLAPPMDSNRHQRGQHKIARPEDKRARKKAIELTNDFLKGPLSVHRFHREGHSNSGTSTPTRFKVAPYISRYVAPTSEKHGSGETDGQLFKDAQWSSAHPVAKELATDLAGRSGIHFKFSAAVQANATGGELRGTLQSPRGPELVEHEEVPLASLSLAPTRGLRPLHQSTASSVHQPAADQKATVEQETNKEEREVVFLCASRREKPVDSPDSLTNLFKNVPFIIFFDECERPEVEYRPYEHFVSNADSCGLFIVRTEKSASVLKATLDMPAVEVTYKGPSFDCRSTYVHVFRNACPDSSVNILKREFWQRRANGLQAPSSAEIIQLISQMTVDCRRIALVIPAHNLVQLSPVNPRLFFA